MLTNLLFATAATVAPEAAELASTLDPAATAAPEISGMASFVAIASQLLPMLLIFGVFYFLMIRPQRKKDKAAKDMLANIKVGDNVCTIGGIYGTVSSLKDDVVTIAVGQDKVKLVFKRGAIATVEEVSIANDAESLI